MIATPVTLNAPPFARHFCALPLACSLRTVSSIKGKYQSRRRSQSSPHVLIIHNSTEFKLAVVLGVDPYDI